jgi:hypothetical protein
VSCDYEQALAHAGRAAARVGGTAHRLGPSRSGVRRRRCADVR